MNKNIKIYLQSPWKFPDSPYYKYLVDCPPRGVEYLNTKKQKGVITNKKNFWFSNFLKRNIRRWTNKFNLAIPNAHLSPDGDYNLIHCAHCLSRNNSPWVADIESWWSMYLSGYHSENARGKVEKILLSDNCKKIMPWTESTKEDIVKRFPKIKDKMEVVYPAVPEIKNLNKPKNKILKIIFIARYFDIKGGLIALEVLERLRRQHGIEGVVVSNVPAELKEKYSKLKIYDLLPQEKLFDLMNKSDIFLYPGSVDTFGFSLLEAMAFGLPIVTINTKYTASRQEIVKDGETGFIFNVDKKLLFDRIRKNEDRVVKELIRKTSMLIENKKLRERMSENCKKVIKEGEFSIGVRNKKLKRIYQEALE